MTSNSAAAAAKPISGEIRRERPTSAAFDQLTPDASPRVMRLFARPTPVRVLPFQGDIRIIR